MPKGDGLKILFCKAGDQLKQAGFCNGWKCDHYITNLCVFGPDGTIHAALLNCPGSIHDSELARKGMPSIYANQQALRGMRCRLCNGQCLCCKNTSIHCQIRPKRTDRSARGRQRTSTHMGQCIVRATISGMGHACAARLDAVSQSQMALLRKR